MPRISYFAGTWPGRRVVSMTWIRGDVDSMAPVGRPLAHDSIIAATALRPTSGLGRTVFGGSLEQPPRAHANR
jgi:hypothetical protein